MPRLFIAAVALLLAGCAGAPPQATPTSGAPTSASDGAAPSDADLQAKWWTWALSSPQARNPVADPTGQFCAEDQPKNVWFLAGTFGGAAQRTCEVPGGRPIAAPAVNLYSANTSDCKSFMAAATGSMTLDGQVVELRRIDPVEITFQAAQDNAIGESAGRKVAQACGLWAWLPPLLPGEHELKIEGESGTFSTSVVYQLKVGAGD
ncbi:hypothetical protein [Lentzea alba]|uniref:hypothetical protein n=1 Tax=Lentzea alba TaxID=2714351 RepID=UPI001A94FE98|nr:hypothetical protein [Lentzea alba]